MGKTLSVSVAEGYKNAMSAIIDGNVTTLITGIVLFVFVRSVQVSLRR